LNGYGFFNWVGWGRLFQLGWMRTAFSNELNENGFFDWLFRLSWLRTVFSNKSNKDVFFEWIEWKCLIWMRIICPRFRAQRVVRALSVGKVFLRVSTTHPPQIDKVH
jgi:hypothetical protein